MTLAPLRPTTSSDEAQHQQQEHGQQRTAADLSPGNPWLDPTSDEAWLVYDEHRVCREVGATRGFTAMSDEAIRESLPGWLNASPRRLASAFHWDREHAPEQAQHQQQDQESQQRAAEALPADSPWLDLAGTYALQFMDACRVCFEANPKGEGWRPQSDDELRAGLIEWLNADQEALAAAWRHEDEKQEEEQHLADLEAKGGTAAILEGTINNENADDGDDDNNSDVEPSGNTTQETVTVEAQPQQQESVKAEPASVEQAQDQCSSVEQGKQEQEDQAIATGYVDPIGYKGSFGTVGVPLRAEAICFNLKIDDTILCYWGRVYQWLKHKGGSAAISRHDAAELLGINKDAWKKFTEWAKEGGWLEVVSTRNRVNTYTFGRAFLEADWVSINAEAQRQLDARRKANARKGS
jgi:hypothetical protein